MVVERSDLSVATYSVASSRGVARASTILTGVGGKPCPAAPLALAGPPPPHAASREREKCCGYRRPVSLHADDSLE